MTKTELQNHFFDKIISLNLPQVQSRFIAYKLVEYGNLEIREVVPSKDNTYITIKCDINAYKIKINPIDVMTNTIEKI